MLDEFNIIRKYFQNSNPQDFLGIGDDAAVLPQIDPNKRLVVTTDTLVENVHFTPDVDPRTLGHKSLAVNLSDLAAMGAQPKYLLLALTLPEAKESWLEKFSAGFWNLASEYSLNLVGGDLTRGPCCVNITAIGLVESNSYLTRSGACVKDNIWVSGTLGSASAIMRKKISKKTFYPDFNWTRLESFLDMPSPRVHLGLELLGVATSEIDISDGLLKDIGHITRMSKVGAKIAYNAIPCERELQSLRDQKEVQTLLLSGGEDYEIAFTAPERQTEKITKIAEKLEIPCTKIGIIKVGSDVSVYDEKGSEIIISNMGFDHFKV